jgi:hypothetical protein
MEPFHLSTGQPYAACMRLHVVKSVRKISALILKLNVMKDLSFEQMEEVHGGRVATYCETLWNWIANDFEGYQGSRSYLLETFMSNCG